jgi:hypothetical protein
MVDLVWEPRYRAHDVPLDLAELRAVEREWGVRFPADYVACVRRHHGCGPEPSRFRFGDGFTTSVQALLHFVPDLTEGSIRQARQALWTAGVPDAVVPFADDPGGNRICFDFRSDAVRPEVVVLDHEQPEENALLPAAPDFAAFLGSLF